MKDTALLPASDRGVRFLIELLETPLDDFDDLFRM